MTASLSAINAFCESVAQRVTVKAVAEQMCEGAKVNPRQPDFLSCPDPSHEEHHITHCSCGGYGSNEGRKFHCFVCDSKGDAVTYVAMWHGISNFAAARLINNCFQLGIPDPCNSNK